MRKLVGLVVILAVLVLGGYYGMGVITERTVKHNVVVINKSNGLFVDIAEYKRGWFSSDALLNWRLHIPERVVKSDDGQLHTTPPQDFDMQMPITIYHGPVIFANHTVKFGLGYAKSDINLPAKYKEQFNNQFAAGSTEPKLLVALFINYLNKSQINLSVPTFKLLAKNNGGQFDWKGLTSSLSATSNARKLKGEVVVNGFQVSKNDTKAEMSAIHLDYNLHQTESGLYLGDAAISLPLFVVNNKDQKLFELDNFDGNSTSNIENGLFSSHLKSSVAKIIANNNTFGPGTLDMSLRNLDADALARINQLANRTQQGSDLEKQQALLAIIPEIPALFSRGPEFQVSELEFVMPQGKVEGNLLISLPKGESSNPLELMQKVQGDGKLTVPGDVLKLVLNESNKQKLALQNAASQNTAQTPQDAGSVAPPPPAPAFTPEQIVNMTNTQLDNMVKTGLLVQQGSDYTIEVKLEKGQLQINGKPFNAAMIKF